MVYDEELASPTLADVFEAALASAAPLKCEPGKVVRYDAAKQLVDVQPLIKEAVKDEEGNVTARERPVIPNVPVVFPGAGGFALTFPIQTGDLVVLLYAHASLDRWLESDGRRSIDPGSPVSNSATDAFALLAPATARVPRNVAPTNQVRLGHDSTNGAVVRITQGEVSIDDGSGAVSLATKADLQSLISYLNSTGLPVVGGGGGTAIGPTTTPAGTTVLKGK